MRLFVAFLWFANIQIGISLVANQKHSSINNNNALGRPQLKPFSKTVKSPTEPPRAPGTKQEKGPPATPLHRKLNSTLLREKENSPFYGRDAVVKSLPRYLRSGKEGETLLSSTRNDSSLEETAVTFDSDEDIEENATEAPRPKARPTVEITDKLASLLCKELSDEIKEMQRNAIPRYTAYLWVPIRNYVPGFAHGVVLESPVFTPNCFKWRLQKCGGTEKWPLMSPCTFWAPLSKKTEKCGHYGTPKMYKEVSGRPEEMVPGHCNCDWPCIPYFDFYQKCRVPVQEEIPMELDEPKNRIEVSHNQALQLCRAIEQITHHTAIIPWIPFRIQNVIRSNGVSTDCASWLYKPCQEGVNGTCEKWTKIQNCLNETVALDEKVDVPPTALPMQKYIPSDAQQMKKGGVGRVGCKCDYPCLPFFDPVNKCYGKNGEILLNERGENYLPPKNFLERADQGLMQCTMRREDISCFVVDSKPKTSKPKTTKPPITLRPDSETIPTVTSNPSTGTKPTNTPKPGTSAKPTVTNKSHPSPPVTTKRPVLP